MQADHPHRSVSLQPAAIGPRIHALTSANNAMATKINPTATKAFNIQRQHKIRKFSSLNGAAEGGVYWRTYLLLPLQHNTSSANENFNCDQGVPNGTASGCVYRRASSTQHYTLHPRDRPRLALRAPLQPAQRCKIRNGARPLGTRCFGSAQWPGGPIDACMPYSYLETSTAVPAYVRFAWFCSVACVVLVGPTLVRRHMAAGAWLVVGMWGDKSLSTLRRAGHITKWFHAVHHTGRDR